MLSVRVMRVEGTYPGRLSQVVQGDKVTTLSAVSERKREREKEGKRERQREGTTDAFKAAQVLFFSLKYEIQLHLKEYLIAFRKRGAALAVCSLRLSPRSFLATTVRVFLQNCVTRGQR